MQRLMTAFCIPIAALVLMASANAQQVLNFADLPLMNTPSPMPNGYGRLDWGNNFYYVNPYGWSDSGPGFRLGPQGEDVAFVGAKNCRLVGYTCYGTLSNSQGFELVSASVAAGFGPTAVTVTAYNNGSVLGSASYFLTTQLQTINFPSSWGVATEVVIQVTGVPDDLVLYSLTLYTLGG